MPTNAPSPVAERIKWARQRVPSLSAREVARLAQLQPSHVSLIESGAVANVRVDTLTALARVLGCSLDWLVNGIGDAPDDDAVRAAVALAAASRPRRADESGEHAAVSDDETGTG
jgi:transcriptional regulator with XRE-family HTH domain